MATITNYAEQLETGLEALVLGMGGTLPAKGSTSNPEEYRIDLLNSAATGTVGGATFGTLTAEAANARTQSIQLTDGNGSDLARRAQVLIYLSDDANGDSIATAGTPAGLAAGTDGLYQQLTANLAGFFTSEVDGDIDVTVTNSGVGSIYIVVVLPSGKLVVSPAIAFA